MYFSSLSLNAHIFNIILLCLFFWKFIEFLQRYFCQNLLLLFWPIYFGGLCFTFPFSLNHLLFIADSSFLWLTFWYPHCVLLSYIEHRVYHLQQYVLSVVFLWFRLDLFYSKTRLLFHKCKSLQWLLLGIHRGS